MNLLSNLIRYAVQEIRKLIISLNIYVFNHYQKELVDKDIQSRLT